MNTIARLHQRMANSSTRSAQMGDLQGATHLPSNPSQRVPYSQRSEVHEKEQVRSTSSIDEKNHTESLLQGGDRQAESGSLNENGHDSTILCKSKEVEKGRDQATSHNNDKVPGFGIDNEKIETVMNTINGQKKNGKVHETETNAAHDEENGENSTMEYNDMQISEIASSAPPNSDIVLSLNDRHYKSAMWVYFRELGRDRDSMREAESADQIFKLFKQHMGTGKFFKLSPFGEKIEVDEKIARAKIIADVRRRLVSYKHWTIKMEGDKKKSTSIPIHGKKRELPIEKSDQTEELITPSSLRRSKRSRNVPEQQQEQMTMRTNDRSFAPVENDIILSLNDERYREVMWKHFRMLGEKTPGDNSREEEMGNGLFQWFKTGLRRGGHFYKKEPRGDELFQVDDELAIQKIVRDLKRRKESSHKWYNHDESNLELGNLVVGSKHVHANHDGRAQQQNTFSAIPQMTPIVVQNPLIGLLESSHLGKRLPPISTLSTVRAIQTPNELTQTLLLATHKLNELSGTSSKHRKQLRLYELRELSAICGIHVGVNKDVPTLAELAEYMETTPKSLRKWFRLYKKALTRRFDFKRFGNDRIRDHYDVFYGSDTYKFNKDAVAVIEQYFEDTATKILQDFDVTLEQPIGRKNDLDANDSGTRNVFNKSTVGDTSSSRKEPISDTSKNNDHCPVSSDGETVFERHYQRNYTRLQYASDCPFQLCPEVKRIDKGQKIRTICMVVGCEKQAQTKCDGCCTAHYRILSSIPHERNYCKKPVMESAIKDELETPACPSVDVGGGNAYDLVEMDLDRLVAGSRIYIEWGGDDTLYKATVKKAMLDRNETIKVHYDGKKRHILDTVSLDMVKGFIAGEDCNGKSSEKRQASAISSSVERQNEGSTELVSDNAPSNKKARSSSPMDNDDAEVTLINFSNVASEPSEPIQSPMARFSPISRNRDRARSIVLISPISTKPFSSCPAELQSQQLNTSAFVGIRSAQKTTASKSRASSDDVSKSVQELFVSEVEVSNVEKSQSHSQLHLPEPEISFKCPKCSADCIYDSRMCSVCFMKSYSVSGQGSVGQQKRNGTLGQKKYPERESGNYTKPQESASKQKLLQPKPVICHCPQCEKGNFTIQGMYAHWGRAHNDEKLPWNRVTYSCPFCHSQRKFNSLNAIESHVNSAHPRCQLLTPNAPKPTKQSQASNFAAARATDRTLRDRRALAKTNETSSVEDTQMYKQPVPEPLKFKKLEYAHLLPDGRKEYPKDLSKVIEMIQMQCKEQEEVVKIALDQRSKLCKEEAAIDVKELREERIAYQRGIRERTRMADQERIEKHRYNERHAELTMRFEYENRNKARDREEIQLSKLCSNPIIIASGKMRHGPAKGARCDNEECQFCREDSCYREHLLLESEVTKFKSDFAADQALDLQQKVQVLNPCVRAVNDGDFSIDGGSGDAITTIPTNGKRKLSNSRRAASTKNRLMTEEDKLLDLQYTKHNLEFIHKYNQGLIKNAWAETKDSRGRKQGS